MKKIKKIFIIFSLSLFFIVSVKAEDISDFEIEGISIGDNLSNHMSKDEISNNDQGHYSKNSKFFETQLTSGSGPYDYLLFHLKRKDKNFKIHVVRGVTEITSLKECMNLKKNAVKEVKNLFPKTKLREGSQKHYYYQSSTQYISQFEFKNGDLVKLECTIYHEKDKEVHGHLMDQFEVSIGTSEFYNWLGTL